MVGNKFDAESVPETESDSKRFAALFSAIAARAQKHRQRTQTSLSLTGTMPAEGR